MTMEILRKNLYPLWFQIKKSIEVIYKNEIYFIRLGYSTLIENLRCALWTYHIE